MNAQCNDTHLEEVISGDNVKIGSMKPGEYLTGTAKVILKESKEKTGLEFSPGDILVARMTEPSDLDFMLKAAAVVTDLGGRTCHAAVVSREFGIYTVLNTQCGTDKIKTGDKLYLRLNPENQRKSIVYMQVKS